MLQRWQGRAERRSSAFLNISTEVFTLWSSLRLQRLMQSTLTAILKGVERHIDKSLQTSARLLVKRLLSIPSDWFGNVSLLITHVCKCIPESILAPISRVALQTTFVAVLAWLPCSLNKLPMWCLSVETLELTCYQKAKLIHKQGFWQVGQHNDEQNYAVAQAWAQLTCWIAPDSCLVTLEHWPSKLSSIQSWRPQ